MPGPLAGVRVVDLTRVLTGPYCTMLLADMGADVVKVEAPSGDETRGWGPPFVEGESTYFMSVNRNKRSLVLDLKSDLGRVALKRLVQWGDVLVENFRPGTAQRLGMSYEQARAINPSIVYCSISGFGQDGPRAQQPAYDAIIQGMSGFQQLTGFPDGQPVRPGLPIADICAGMFAAYAIVCALRARDADPHRRGQDIDTSMLASQAAMLTHQSGRYFATGTPPQRYGNRHPSIAPYETFATADGFVNVACGNEGIWRRFCSALDLGHLPEDPRFLTNRDRVSNRDDLAAAIEARVQALTTAEVERRLGQAEVPVGQVFDLGQLFSDPQSEHLDLAQRTPHATIADLRTTGFPYRLSRTPAAVRHGPPLLGEHTKEVLAELGLMSPASDPT